MEMRQKSRNHSPSFHHINHRSEGGRRQFLHINIKTLVQVRLFAVSRRNAQALVHPLDLQGLRIRKIGRKIPEPAATKYLHIRENPRNPLTIRIGQLRDSKAFAFSFRRGECRAQLLQRRPAHCERAMEDLAAFSRTIVKPGRKRNGK